ncbi:MAG: hypothetical protein H6679_04300 [Epsilonproteobacteria bacterium]|nr:hypothetical protein [Campylobacterota bacterium]
MGIKRAINGILFAACALCINATQTFQRVAAPDVVVTYFGDAAIQEVPAPKPAPNPESGIPDSIPSPKPKPMPGAPGGPGQVPSPKPKPIPQL